MADIEPLRKLILHFGTCVQTLKFFPSGSREDLLASILEVMGLPNRAPLRFRDENGDVVAVSPCGIPSEMVLHVSVEEGCHSMLRLLVQMCRLLIWSAANHKSTNLRALF